MPNLNMARSRWTAQLDTVKKTIYNYNDSLAWNLTVESVLLLYSYGARGRSEIDSRQRTQSDTRNELRLFSVIETQSRNLWCGYNADI